MRKLSAECGQHIAKSKEMSFLRQILEPNLSFPLPTVHSPRTKSLLKASLILLLSFYIVPDGTVVEAITSVGYTTNGESQLRIPHSQADAHKHCRGSPFSSSFSHLYFPTRSSFSLLLCSSTVDSDSKCASFNFSSTTSQTQIGRLSSPVQFKIALNGR